MTKKELKQMIREVLLKEDRDPSLTYDTQPLKGPNNHTNTTVTVYGEVAAKYNEIAREYQRAKAMLVKEKTAKDIASKQLKEKIAEISDEAMRAETITVRTGQVIVRLKHAEEHPRDDAKIMKALKERLLPMLDGAVKQLLEEIMEIRKVKTSDDLDVDIVGEGLNGEGDLEQKLDACESLLNRIEGVLGGNK